MDAMDVQDVQAVKDAQDANNANNANDAQGAPRLTGEAGTAVLSGESPGAGGQAWQQQESSVEALRNNIYGTGGRPSLIEIVGQALYAAARKRGEEPDLGELFANARYLAFRLLFLAFFESRYLRSRLLPKKCRYSLISLQSIFQSLETLPEEELESFTAWRNLQGLCDVIDKGDENLFICRFNGGLFSRENAPLLAWSRVLDNRQLREILEMLFLDKGQERDFSVLPVTQLGTIYLNTAECPTRKRGGEQRSGERQRARYGHLPA